MKLKKGLLVCTACVLFFALCIASLMLGAERISFADIRLLRSDPFIKIILIDIRLIRTIAAFLCGALLAVSGTVFQGLFRNNLADPYMMGVSSGSTLGAVCAVSLTAAGVGFAGGVSIAFGAFCGALSTAAIVYIIAEKSTKISTAAAILLTGAAASAFFSAVTSLIILIRDKELYKIYMWTMGSFNGKTAGQIVGIVPFALAAFFLAFVVSRPLDILSSGEQNAQALGVNMRTMRPLMILCAALASACAVALGGTIGFIGLIAPHSARLLLGTSQHRSVLLVAGYIGGMLLLMADIVSRLLLAPSEIPVGIICAFMGAPFFVWLLMQKARSLL